MNRHCLVALVSVATVAISACDGLAGKKAGGPPPTPARTAAPAAAQPQGPAAQIKAELASQNFGRAAELATSASAANPGEPELHLLLARAEGYLGNTDAAITALEKAVLTGLQDRRGAFADPAFDRIRDDAAFQDAERRLLPHPTAERPSPKSRMVAGDVEISEGGGRERIRAGDVVLETKD